MARTLTDNPVRVPLRANTEVVIIPDSLAGYFPPIAPLAVPAVAEAPGVEIGQALVPIAAPAQPEVTEYSRWTASEYVMCGLAVALVAIVAGIVVAAVHVLAGVFAAVSAVVAFVSSAGGVVVAIAVVALAWRLVGKLGHSNTEATPAVAVTTTAPPAVTVKATIKPDTVTEAVHEVSPVVSPVDFPVDEPAPMSSHYAWWGGKTKEGKAADRQKRLAKLDPRARQWVQDLRDPSSKQAKGTYDDGADRYCAVGIETHKHRRMTHEKMCRAFGWNFVRDVENFNDGTAASFEDVAVYIEDHLS